MKWTNTKTTATVGIAILAAVAVAMVVKHQFPQVKDSYFDPDTDKLRQLPANLAVVRPTHFPKSSAKMRHVHENSESVTRTLGRNVPLRDAIAEAYDCNPSRVVLPADAPKGGFDFLVTTGNSAQDDLRKAIEKKLGYAAHRETRDVDVWGLKVQDPNLPGLTVSPAGELADEKIKDGKLYLTHQSLSSILDGLSQGLNEPVVDETGLTNYYDFSVTWNDEIQKRMQTGAFDLEGVKKVLAGWGLRLEQDNQPIDVFVVEKAR
jgi:uncharacterized protein (TIGR03435 family)